MDLVADEMQPLLCIVLRFAKHERQTQLAISVHRLFRFPGEVGDALALFFNGMSHWMTRVAYNAFPIFRESSQA